MIDIRQWRIEHGYTVAAFSRITGVHRKVIERAEAGMTIQECRQNMPGYRNTTYLLRLGHYKR